MSPPGQRSVWEDNSPDTLLDICTRFVLQHPQTYCCYNSAPGPGAAGQDGAAGLAALAAPTAAANTETSFSFPYHPVSLLPDLHLPMEICEKLFTMLQEEGLDVSDDTALVFSDTECSRLRSVNVRNSSITDRGLLCLLRHNLRDLDIHNCEAISQDTLESLNRHSGALVNLNIGNSVHILPDYLLGPTADAIESSEDIMQDSLDEEDRARAVYESRGYILHAPNLQRLALRDLFVTRGANYLDLLLRPLQRLTQLDLSGLHHNEGLHEFKFLRHLPWLASLVLHNVRELPQAVNTIAGCKTLRHLDISQCDEKHGTYEHPKQLLSTLVENLPLLSSLDISGTNLAGEGSFESSEAAGRGDDGGGGAAKKRLLPVQQCDIPGLECRVENPLDFLGLYKTKKEACCRAHIPAKEISGDSNENQILVAGQHYLDRPVVIENVLNDLFHIFRYGNCVKLREALDILLLAMDRHPGEKIIQIASSASLYYVVKSEIRTTINIKMKKKILATLLNGMFAHRNDPVMMRNGCLTLCQFSIPNDVIFDYERLVSILLFIVSEHTSDENVFVQRAGIYLLNSLACQVDGQQKLLVGNLGAMEKMLAIIKERVLGGVCDDVMETAWSCMWNVTDETPVNCKRFLDGDGMALFLRCKETFPEKQDLLRNMMGLLGNVAEVPSLRAALMTKEFVTVFSQLLESNSDGIEVSYNATGVLAHMASDGAHAWLLDRPRRQDVLDKMVEAIERWNLDTKRNINYRSFEPILRLVRVQDTPQCQHWAVWALANLTRVDSKYCSLVEQEGGLTLLEELINSNVSDAGTAYPRVIELANIVRENVTMWKELGVGGRMAVDRQTSDDDTDDDEDAAPADVVVEQQEGGELQFDG